MVMESLLQSQLRCVQRAFRISLAAWLFSDRETLNIQVLICQGMIWRIYRRFWTRSLPLGRLLRPFPPVLHLIRTTPSSIGPLWNLQVSSPSLPSCTGMSRVSLSVPLKPQHQVLFLPVLQGRLSLLLPPNCGD